jgi:hypothetical protein
MLKNYWRRPIFKLVVLLTFLLCLAFLASGASPIVFFGKRTDPQVNSTAMRPRGIAQHVGRSDTSEPTPVQEGLLTDKEKAHSKIYEKEYGWRKAQRLRDLRGAGEIQVTILEPTIPDDPNAPALTDTEFLVKMSCQADALVIGTVQNKSSQLTEDGKFAFSQYGLHVNEILKNNNGATALTLNSDLEITRPGGAIRLNGRVIRVADESFPRLEVGAQYLVFLKFIPATGSYKALRQGDYELIGDRFSPLVGEGLPAEIRRGGNRTSFLALVRNAISIGCN